MLPINSDELGEKTRRWILKATAGVLGAGAAAGLSGSASAHTKGYGGLSGYFGTNVANARSGTELVGHHSLGAVGPASETGKPEDVHHGGQLEFRVHDDVAFISIFSARGEDAQRGVAVLDVSDFTRAESKADLKDAELSVLSFVRNENSAAACMDLKVSDDGNYVFVCKQAAAALFGETEPGPPNVDDLGTTNVGAGSLVAVDVSDPEFPVVTDEVHAGHWSIGPHNGWYHQIGGEEYVFTVSGTLGVQGGVGVFRFDRTSGQLQLVNTWQFDDNVSQGGCDVEASEWYSHDINVQEDPKTGIPLAYVHWWDAGLRIYDISDPLDAREVGVFEMNAAHHAVPAPTLVHGKRVAAAAHEVPAHTRQDRDNEEGNPGETGRIHLIDCDPLDAALDPDSEVERVYLGCASPRRENDRAADPGARYAYAMYDAPDDQVVDDSRLEDGTELDTWVLIDGPNGESWEDAPGFEEEAEKAGEDPEGRDDDSPGEYSGFDNYRLSPHNMDIDTDGRLYMGHYHCGARFFEITENFDLEETAYFRDGFEIPTESAMIGDNEGGSGLTASTPFFWSVVERNGLAFGGCINSGPHVLHQRGSEVGRDTPVDVNIGRDHSRPAELGGQIHRITITAESDEEVMVRDWLPEGWTVGGGHVTDTVDVAGRTGVTLQPHNGEATYYVRAPDATGSGTFGPVEYARATDGVPDVDSEFGGGNNTTNRLWRKENGAVQTVGSAGAGIDI